MYDQNAQGSFSPTLSPQTSNMPIPAMDYNFPNKYRAGGSVSSLQDIINRIKNQGEEEDQILAYINPEEAQELDQMSGHDINPHTGLPQFGFFKKLKKYGRKILPVAGALLGNYIAPGIGGVIGGGVGGGLGGALGSKHPLKKGLTGGALGAALGALQGYGLPAAGRYLSSQGMPQIGGSLIQAGGSRFLPAFQALTSPAPQAIAGLGGAAGASLAPNALASLMPGASETAGAGGLGNILNYLLLGATGIGTLGRKVKYKVPKEYKNEPSIEEMMKRLRAPEGPKKYIEPYRAPSKYFEVPRVTETEYEYPTFGEDEEEERSEFKKGGEVRQKLMYGGQGRGRGRGGSQIPPGTDPRTAAILMHQQRNREMQERGRQQQAAQKGTVAPVRTPAPPNMAQIAASPDPRAAAIAEHQRYNREIQQAGRAQQEQQRAAPPPRIRVAEVSPQENVSSLERALQSLAERQQSGLLQQERDPLLGGLLNSPLFRMGGLLEDIIQYIPEGEEIRPSSSTRSSAPLEPYRAPPAHFEVPRVTETEYEYPQFKKGGLIEGPSGGQDDDRPHDLDEGDYIVDATTVSLLGDGNTKAGKVQLDKLLNKFSHLVPHYAKGDKVKKVPALISDGEYRIERPYVTALGSGDNNKGAKSIRKMIANIRKHKRVKGLPPKSKPLDFYLERR